jgi:cell division protein FtsB
MFFNAAAATLKVADAASKAPNISPFGPLNTSLISIMLGVLAIILKNQIAHRKMTIQVNGEVRHEFIEEMQALRSEVKGLRDENVNLRQEVRELHAVIDGMRREGLSGQISAQRVVAEMMPQTPAMERALRSLDNVVGDRKS